MISSTESLKTNHILVSFRKTILALILSLTACIPCAKSQCGTFIQLVPSAEDCILPVVVRTQQLLMPCSAPSGFFQLVPGDFAYIDYRDTTCTNLCHTGQEVTITCFSLLQRIDNPEASEVLNVSPVLVESFVTIEGKGIEKIEVYHVFGKQLLQVNQLHVSGINLETFSPGIYFIKLFTPTQVEVKKIIKL